jgi:hypothetical protein
MANEVLRDRSGAKIAEIETNGSKRILRDRYGSNLGEYDSRENKTRDRRGSLVGAGDLLLMLLR